ncbi:MAG: transglutaminase family protein [Candidatus Velthaea sp.]
MQFTILHQTTYRYPAKIHESYSICHLQPRSDLTQYCTKFELSVAPRTRMFAYTDRFANDVHHFAVLPDHDVLSIISRSDVATVRPEQTAAGATRAELAADPALKTMYDFLHESAYVAFGPALRELALEVGLPAEDLGEWYAHAGHAIKTGFSYDSGATSVRTTVDESVSVRGGVCQDFAHVLVALCRFSGIPARYVSGYIFSGQEGSILGAEASHAWCEAYLPPYGWVGFDPTNDKFLNDEFVKIAVGRDYRDVSPVRGIYKGDSTSTMSVNVGMETLPNQ